MYVAITLILVLYSSFCWVYLLRSLSLFEKPKWSTIGAFFLIGAICYAVIGNFIGAHEFPIADLGFLSFEIFLIKVCPFLIILSLSTYFITLKGVYDTPYILVLNSSLALGYICFELYYMESSYFPFWMAYYTLCVFWIYSIWSGLISQSVIFLKQGLMLKALSHLVLVILLMVLFYMILHYEDELSERVRNIYLVIFPFVHIQIGASLMNNALNASPNFEKRTCLRSNSLASSAAYLIIVLLLLLCLFLSVSYGMDGFLIFSMTVFAPVFYFYILINRMTSFFLVKNRIEQIWNLAPIVRTDFERLSPGAGSSFTIKGLGFDESLFTEKIMEWVNIYPQNSADTFLDEETEIRITDKFYVEDTSIIYPIEFKTLPKQLDANKYNCIVPKLFGTRRLKKLHIMALFELDRPITEDGMLDTKPLHVEWIYWGIRIKKQRFWENLRYFMQNKDRSLTIDQGQSMAKS